MNAQYKPLLILVSGAPGSGKTTLARKLADELYLPHINRDSLYWGMRFTAHDKTIEVVSTGVPLFYAVLTQLLTSGVSIVADATLYKGKSEADIKPLLQIADIINIHCRAANAVERFEKREAAEPPERTLASTETAITRAKKDALLFTNPLDLGCDTIEINTTHAYEPSVDTIVKILRSRPSQ